MIIGFFTGGADKAVSAEEKYCIACKAAKKDDCANCDFTPNPKF